MTETASNTQSDGTQAPDWVEIRKLYELGRVPVREICAAYGIHSGKLYYRAMRQGWRMRNAVHLDTEDGLTRKERLSRQLLDALELRIALMDEESACEALTPDVAAKEARLIASLAKTLETLTAQDATQAKTDDTNKHGGRDLDAKRKDLAQRLAKLVGNAGL
jgi:hypothetical protein